MNVNVSRTDYKYDSEWEGNSLIVSTILNMSMSKSVNMSS